MLNRRIRTLLTLLVLLLGVNLMPATTQEIQTETTVAIAPLNGTVRTPIQVIANGFPPNIGVYIGMGQPASEYEIIGTAQTDAYGLVATQVLIPSYVDASEVDELVVVVGAQDVNVLDAISTPFTLMDNNEMVTPTVNLVPRAGVAGSDATVSIAGFPPNEDIILGVAPQNSEFDYSLRVTTDANGTAVTEVSIPSDARANRDWIVLAEVESDRDYQALSPTFRVTGSEPTPQPDGTMFTSSDIYLIGLGSTSGVAVGCNDVAIPVEVNYEPTVAPLRASLEALFDIETRVYGQSGLYNALYQSDLSVDSITIENGLATINIDGQLVVGGACDTPRALAQIEQTALQFSTVDDVSIIIDGQPYL